MSSLTEFPLKPLLQFGSGGAAAVGAGATTFIGVGISSATEAQNQVNLTGSKTYRTIAAHVSVAPGVGQSHTMTVRKNGVDTAMTLTISGANTDGNSSANSVTFALGDDVSIKDVVTAGATVSIVHVTLSE